MKEYIVFVGGVTTSFENFQEMMEFVAAQLVKGKAVRIEAY